MSSPLPPDPPPAGPRRHRADTGLREAVRRVAPPLVAVVAVVAVIVLLLVVNSRPSRSGPAPGAVAAAPTGISPAPARSTPSGSTSSPTAARSTAPAQSSVSQSPVGQPPVSEPPATQPPASAPVEARPAVTVLNNSRRHGLAADVAAQLRARQWPVAKTGNFRGRIAETTVYYASGQRAAADDLARMFPQIRRVAPRFAGLPGSGLTLVVTRDWS